MMYGGAAAMLSLARANLDGVHAKAFDRWLAGMLDRLAKLAPFDVDIPLSMTPAEREMWSAKIAAEWRELVSTAPWQTSLHLTPPAQMRAAGFKGTPYKTPR